MAKGNYPVRDFQRDFPNDAACLEFIFDTKHTRECSCGGTYKPMFRWNSETKKLDGRKQFYCSKCATQIAPRAGTIFNKSETPLTLWFHALWVFSNAKSGISAKELQRHIGSWYKTSYRILKMIRTALPQETDKLKGEVEMDIAYFGGKGNAGKNNARLSDVMKAKTVVIGAVERGGRARIKVVPNAGAATIYKFVEENIEKGTRLITDSARTYELATSHMNRDAVNHSKSYTDGDIHINNIETLWGHIKRSLKGTHKTISGAQLQSYLDAFVFHYNNRHSDTARFQALLGNVLRAGG